MSTRRRLKLYAPWGISSVALWVAMIVFYRDISVLIRPLLMLLAVALMYVGMSLVRRAERERPKRD